MRMNTNIPLSIQPFDMGRAAAQGAAIGSAIEERQQKNALREFMQRRGGDVFAGDASALGEYAQFDPQGAMQIQRGYNAERRADAGLELRREESARADERLKLAHAEGMRAAERLAFDMDQAEAGRQSEAIEQAVKMGLAADTSEEWDVLVSEPAPQLVGQFDRREEFAASFLGMSDVLARYSRGEWRPASQAEASLYGESAGQFDPENRFYATGGDSGAPSAAEAQLSRMGETGMDRETAILIRDGVIERSRDPVTGEVTLIDMRTGRPWEGAQKGATQPGQQNPPQPQPAPQTPAQRPDDLSFGDAYPNAPAAFGASGFGARVANTVSDALTGRPAFPDVQQAQNDFAVLGEQLRSDMMTAYNGRPSVYLMQQIDRLIPQGGQFFEGPSQAASQLRSLGRSLEQEREALAGQQGRRMRPNDRAELNAKVQAVENAMVRVRESLSALTGGGGASGGRTESGIQFRIIE